MSTPAPPLLAVERGSINSGIGAELDALRAENARLAQELQSLRTSVQQQAMGLMCHARTLDKLRLHVGKLWFGHAGKFERLMGFLLRPIVRKRCEFELSPVHDVEMRDQTRMKWRSVGSDPSFILDPLLGYLPHGWVIFRTSLVRRAPNFTAKLYLNSGKGFSEAEAIQIPVSRKGTIQEVIRIPLNVKAIRFDPLESVGEFDLGRLTFTEIGSIERIYRMVRRIVPMLWLKTSVVCAQVGLTWMRMFLDLQGAYEASGQLRSYAPEITYPDWVSHFGGLSDAERSRIRKELARLRNAPLISVLMPVYNAPPAYLNKAINSVINQLYPHWELCIADDCSSDQALRDLLTQHAKSDRRIKVVFRGTNGHISAASNTALELATGDYVALLDHDDELSEDALYHVAREINAHPDLDIVYSDEDKLDSLGNRYDPHFKSDWNPDLFLAQNYLSHLGVYRTELVRQVGGFRTGYEGSQDYDLALRCLAQRHNAVIRHIPAILYHWRAVDGSTAKHRSEKDYATLAGIKALQDYLEQRGDLDFEVEMGRYPTTYRVRYPLPNTPPKVSLIIPTRDHCDILSTCISSILEKTTYQNYEIVIVDNQSEDPDTCAYLKQIVREQRVRVLNYPHPFNYSAINNHAVEHCTGELLGLVNNDIEVISPDWLTEMVSHAARPEVGTVGAKLYYTNGTIQHAGVIVGLGGVAGHSHKHFPQDAPGYFYRLNVVQNVSAVTAACMLVRRAVYEEVGGLNDKELTIAFNDVDFCLKVREAGYRNVWTPYAELYHHESVSRGAEDTPEKAARFSREVAHIKATWGRLLERDPFYSPHLTLEREDFSIAQVIRSDVLN